MVCKYHWGTLQTSFASESSLSQVSGWSFVSASVAVAVAALSRSALCRSLAQAHEMCCAVFVSYESLIDEFNRLVKECA